MRSLSRIILCTLSIFFSYFTATGQLHPCFRINSEGAVCTNTTGVANPFNLTGNSATYHIYDDPRSLGGNTLARYKAFWIYGDGNFKYNTDSDMPGDIGTLTQDYTYSRAGNFTPRVVLTEKKSNTKPPEVSARNVRVTSTNNTGTPFKHTLTVDNPTMNIFNNEFMRPDYPTAFVVSSPPDPFNLGVFFFFNCKDNNGNGVFGPDTVQTIEGVELPTYCKDAGITSYQTGLTSTLSSVSIVHGGASELQRFYRNYLYVQINPAAITQMPPGFNEYRIFPILKTIWKDSLPNSQFAALVVGYNPPNAADTTTVRSILRQIFKATNIPQNFIIGDTTTDDQILLSLKMSAIQQGSTIPIYVKGAAILNVPMVSSIDPNEIQVLQICKLSDDSYEVKGRMEVCNKGYLAEDTVGVRILDANNLFANFQLDNPATIANFQELTVDGIHQWTFNWAAMLGEIPHPLSKNIKSDHQPQCRELTFTVKAQNWSAVEKLRDGVAIEMCVAFRNANSLKEECHFNITIDSLLVDQKNGYNCGDDDCHWLWYILALIIVLIILFWKWLKQFLPQST